MTILRNWFYCVQLEYKMKYIQPLGIAVLGRLISCVSYLGHGARIFGQTNLDVIMKVLLDEIST